jgi:hypothetical protein
MKCASVDYHFKDKHITNVTELTRTFKQKKERLMESLGAFGPKKKMNLCNMVRAVAMASPARRMLRDAEGC